MKTLFYIIDLVSVMIVIFLFGVIFAYVFGFVMRFLSKLFWKFVIWRIRKGYGANCPIHAEGCHECRAKKVIEFLENHITLL